MHFPTGWECVMCRESKLTNSQGWTKLANSLTFDSHVTRSCSLKQLQVCQSAGAKQTISSLFFLFFSWEVQLYNKTLNDWSLGKQWVFFPLNLNIPFGFASVNIQWTLSQGNQNSTFSLGQVITCKCLLTDGFGWVLLVISIDCDSLSSRIKLHVTATFLFHAMTKETGFLHILKTHENPWISAWSPF